MTIINQKIFDLLKAHLLTNGIPQKLIYDLPEETIYNIDLNTRTLEAPKILGASKDHNANFIYFCVDKYYDNMDLSNTIAAIHYKNKNAKLPSGAPDQGHVYFAPFYNTSIENKLIFPWLISGAVTAAAGPVEFAVRFYKVDSNLKDFSFVLNTQPATSQVLSTLNVITPYNENFYIEADVVSELNNRIDTLEKWALYWEDLVDDET